MRFMGTRVSRRWPPIAEGAFFAVTVVMLGALEGTWVAAGAGGAAFGAAAAGVGAGVAGAGSAA